MVPSAIHVLKMDKKKQTKGWSRENTRQKAQNVRIYCRKMFKITDLFRSSIIKPSVTGICHSADSDSLALNTQERILQDKIVTAEPISMPGNMNEVSEIENEVSDLDFFARPHTGDLSMFFSYHPK